MKTIRRLSSMMMMMCAGAMLLSGCAVTEEFPGYPSADVWAALKAAAREPDYHSGEVIRRWTVLENQTWVHEGERRIEVLRSVRRHLHRENSTPLDERRTWSMRVLFEPGEADKPPSASFRIRDPHLPKDAVYEGERYFRDVYDLLGPPPRVAIERVDMTEAEDPQGP